MYSCGVGSCDVDRPAVRWRRPAGHAQGLADGTAGSTGHSYLNANVPKSWGVGWPQGALSIPLVPCQQGPHHVRLETDWDYRLGGSHFGLTAEGLLLLELFQGDDVAVSLLPFADFLWSTIFNPFWFVFQNMYVGYLLDKESGMYHQGPVRRSSINLPPQNFVSTPQYPDFTGYHHVPNMDTHAQSTGSWGPSYGAPREDWGAYSLGPPNTIPTPINNSSPAQVPYCSSDYTHMHPPGSSVLPPPPDNVNVAQLSPDRERRNSSFQWMCKTAQSSSTGELDKMGGFIQLCARGPCLERSAICALNCHLKKQKQKNKWKLHFLIVFLSFILLEF